MAVFLFWPIGALFACGDDVMCGSLRGPAISPESLRHTRTFIDRKRHTQRREKIDNQRTNADHSLTSAARSKLDPREKGPAVTCIYMHQDCCVVFQGELAIKN
nr:hypothetical protein [Pandoravirus massiliensis]